MGFPVYAEHTPPACKDCGGPCRLSNIADDGEPPMWVSLSPICPACARKRRAALAQRARDERAEERTASLATAWAKFGPSGENNADNIYRAVDFNRLPNPDAARRVLEWNPRKRRGLIVYGDTAQGKTFMLYALAKKCILEHGVEPMLFTGPGLRTQVSEAARSADTTRRAALIARIINAPVLMIDDIGHAAKSETAEEALWEIAEGRTSRERPIIITTNFIGERFSERFLKPETGSAIIRRLSTFADSIRAAKI